MRRFVADASHELRTPLTSIRGLAEFHKQRGDDAGHAEATRLMAGIEKEASRMGVLVDDLLLLAHLDQRRPLDLRPVDLGSIASEAVQAARAVEPERSVVLRAAPSPVIVQADAARLRQVIDNLLSNALKHTPSDAAVTVVVELERGGGQITVADRGPGMTEEQASRVFERFYRTDSSRARATGGSGLGLSIAAAIVEAHAGTITVETSTGKGASFRVRLPRARRSQAGAARDSATVSLTR
jgi:two-component system OmpR family sensor kinase